MIADVETLRRGRPEWSPWLRVVDQALRETREGRWEGVVPDVETNARPPLLSGVSVVVDERSIRRMLERLIAVATSEGTPKMSTLERALRADLDIPALFAASICHDTDRIAEVAAASGADDEALQATVALLPLPFLQACNRRWRALVPPAWSEGYCPICGTWPAFAEMRGIERNRYLRCGRCGGEWRAHILRCAFCGTADHHQLASLVPEKEGSGAVDACRQCRGYMKVFTRLQGCPAAEVMLQDFASVDLDVAALKEGYTRRANPGREIDLAVVTTAPRFLSWNA